MDTFNPQPPVSPNPISSFAPEKKSSGPLIAVIVILLIIIVGGLYFLNQQMNRSRTLPTDSETTEESDNVTTSLEAQGNTDDLDSIEADLNATSIDSLDQGAAAIESETNM
ncbi:MAG TPA: hypothetical protein VJH67_03170 [Candidatus Paceibacterota bacterium]